MDERGYARGVRLNTPLAVYWADGNSRRYLGKRRRVMAVLVALLGLSTFAVPLIQTDPPVLRRGYWSPLAIVEQTQAGALPLGTPTVAVSAADEALQYADLLCGFLFAYGMLAVAFLAVVIGGSIAAIRWSAGLCMGATLANMAFGEAAYRNAFYAGGDTSPVHAGVQGCVLVGVGALLMLISSIDELDSSV